MFESPLAFAAALEKALRENSMANSPRLRVFWEVKGMFDGTYALRFYLHSPDLAQSTRHWFRLNLMEQRLKADFRVLTAIILMLSERWPMKHHVNAGDKESKQHDIGILAASLNAVESVRVRRVSPPCVRSFLPPQILFESSVEFAAALRKELHADEISNSPRLRIPWNVSAVWTNVLTSCFVCNPDMAACYKGLQRPGIGFFSRTFRKKQLAQEITVLEATVGRDYEILSKMISSVAARMCRTN